MQTSNTHRGGSFPLACGRIRRGDFPGAENALRGVLEETPDFKKAWSKLVQVVAKRDIAEARSIFDKAVNSGNFDAVLFSTMMAAYLRRNMEPEALEVFERSKKMGACDSDTFRILARFYYLNERYHEADDVFSQAPVELSSHPNISLLRLEIILRQSDYKKAFRESVCMLSHCDLSYYDITYLQASIIRAYALLGLGKHADALFEFKDLYENMPRRNAQLWNVIRGMVLLSDSFSSETKGDMRTVLLKAKDKKSGIERREIEQTLLLLEQR